MRDEILTYLKTLKLKNFRVASEVPFEPNGTALYLKNPKTIYVDTEQTVTEPFIQLFNKTIDQEIITVAVYLANDAKQLPLDYSDVVGLIRKSKDVVVGKYFVRTSDLTTEYQNDSLVTKVEIQLSRIIN